MYVCMYVYYVYINLYILSQHLLWIWISLSCMISYLLYPSPHRLPIFLWEHVAPLTSLLSFPLPNRLVTCIAHVTYRLYYLIIRGHSNTPVTHITSLKHQLAHDWSQCTCSNQLPLLLRHAVLVQSPLGNLWVHIPSTTIG